MISSLSAQHARLLLVLLAVCCWLTALHAQEPAALEDGADAVPALGLRVRSLKEFGPAGTAAEAERTWAAALEELTDAGGGVLLVPEDVHAGAKLENTARWSHCLKPDSDDRLHYWGVAPGVFAIDNRGGKMTLRVPQLGSDAVGAGVTLERILRLQHGDSVCHATKDAVVDIKNHVIHGTCSYRDVTAAPVQAGTNTRFYVHNIRGIFHGMYLNVAAKVPREGSKYLQWRRDEIIVRDIGYDPGKRMHFFTADTKKDFPAGTDLQNKTHNPAIRIENNYHAPNQTFDIYMYRKQYSHGDSYMYHGRFGYMGNVNSGGGDENGACFTSYIYSLYNSFTGRVAGYEAQRNRLVFEQAQFADTLSSTRPLINLNQEKWITRGKVFIVPAEAYDDTTDTGRYPFRGRTYPTTLRAEDGVMGLRKGLRMGGLIRGDADCPWDEGVIGRYFAVDEPGEYVPRTAFGGKLRGVIRRWYEVTDVKRNSDGTKDLLIKRYWWGAKEAGSPTLYDPENYTWDGHERPLSYIIAPGAYVYDVAEAVDGSRAGKPPRALYIAPGPDTGSPFDFEPGDPITQAIGADPFKPQGMRIITGDAVPGAWPSGIIDCYNAGSVERDYCFKVRSRDRTLEECDERPDRRPPYGSVLNIDTASRIGLDCRGDFTDAALLFRQPNREQPIKWHYAHEQGRQPREAVMTVSPETGELSFRGGGARFDGPVTTTGLSGGPSQARNLRGVNVPVDQGATSVEVLFAEPEADAEYAVFVEQNWLSNRAVVEQSAEGFVVQFEQPAPEAAKLHWMIVR